jgi:hypothetical protein
MIHQRYLQLLWILAAGGVGFAVTAVGSGRLRLPRARLLAPHTVTAVAFGTCFRSPARPAPKAGVGAPLIGGMEVDQS